MKLSTVLVLAAAAIGTNAFDDPELNLQRREIDLQRREAQFARAKRAYLTARNVEISLLQGRDICTGHYCGPGLGACPAGCMCSRGSCFLIGIPTPPPSPPPANKAKAKGKAAPAPKKKGKN